MLSISQILNKTKAQIIQETKSVESMTTVYGFLRRIIILSEAVHNITRKNQIK